MSLTGSRFSSDSAPRPFHHGDSKTRWNNLSGGLAVDMTAGPSGQTISPHPSSREGHHSTARWSSISSYHGSQATGSSLVHRNSVPSTHMRCMITANRRASATIAFFIPRCLAIFIAQALNGRRHTHGDHWRRDGSRSSARSGSRRPTTPRPACRRTARRSRCTRTAVPPACGGGCRRSSARSPAS